MKEIPLALLKFAMMNNALTICISSLSLVFVMNYGITQNSGEFNVGLNTSWHQYSMEELNSFLTDPKYYDAIIYPTTPQNKVQGGMSYSISLNYHPGELFSFGLFGTYHNGGFTRDHSFTYYDYSLDQYQTVEFQYIIKTQAISTGIKANLYFNKLLGFDKKTSVLLNRLRLCLDLEAGVGFAKLNDLSIAGFEMQYYNHSASSFQGKIGLGVGYGLTKSPIITTIAVKGGYQYFKTGHVRNSQGDVLPNTNGEVSVGLDFSGFYGGVFLTLGK